MSFKLGKVGGTLVGTALGGPVGGLLGNQWGDMTRKPGTPGAPPPRPLMNAKDVALPAGLAASIGGIGTAAYDKIGSNYGAASKKMPTATNPNSYAGQRFSTQQGLDKGALGTTLGGGLADTAYKNSLEQRGYDENTGLARQIAALNKPSTLQEILGGIGSVGGAGAQVYGAFGKNKKASSGGAASDFSSNGPMSLYDPNQSGYSRYAGGF